MLTGFVILLVVSSVSAAGPSWVQPLPDSHNTCPANSRIKKHGATFETPAAVGIVKQPHRIMAVALEAHCIGFGSKLLNSCY